MLVLIRINSVALKLRMNSYALSGATVTTTGAFVIEMTLLYLYQLNFNGYKILGIAFTGIGLYLLMGVNK